jgi:hypothetical protein
VGDNPVEGIRVLAAQRDGSYQVFLWRAQHYLEDQFRDTPFEKIKSTLEGAGAKQIEEWGTDENSYAHVVRYSIQENLLKSRIGRWSRCVIELRHAPKASVTFAQVSILAEFGMKFKTAAARRDFPKGTVLDRVFGLVDLEQRARETPRLDTIEVSYGQIGYISTPDLGNGFHLKVALSNPFAHGGLRDQRVYYMACSDLDPLGAINRGGPDQKATVHVARDALVPGAVLSGLLEHGYPETFGSIGSN